MTPEKALGRLINLREQLTDEEAIQQGIVGVVTFSKSDYCYIIDDLDDVIRSIKREIDTGICSDCPEPDGDPLGEVVVQHIQGMHDCDEPEDDRDEDEHRSRRMTRKAMGIECDRDEDERR